MSSPLSGIECVIPIVVGAHPRAETTDRPIAQSLSREIALRLDVMGYEGPPPLTCCDLWYLNDQDLRLGPVIAIGSPDVNAATAWLATRIPTAFVHDDHLRIHLDVELVELRACLWGVTPTATADAVAIFVERYLDEFLGWLGA